MSTDASTYYPPTFVRWHRWLTASTIVVAIGMLVVDDALKTNEAPLGIISLQLAGSTSAARRVVNDWHYSEKLAAAFGLGLDYLFLLSYSLWFFLGCRWAAHRWATANAFRGRLFYWLAWGAIVAAVLDAVENAVLLIFLRSETRSVLYPLAYFCAVPKFLLILTSIGIWISGNFAPRDAAAAKPATPAKK